MISRGKDDTHAKFELEIVHSIHQAKHGTRTRLYQKPYPSTFLPRALEFSTRTSSFFNSTFQVNLGSYNDKNLKRFEFSYQLPQFLLTKRCKIQNLGVIVIPIKNVVILHYQVKLRSSEHVLKQLEMYEETLLSSLVRIRSIELHKM